MAGTVEAFDAANFKLRLAALVGVEPATVTLSVTAASVTAASVKVAATIQVVGEAASVVASVQALANVPAFLSLAAGVTVESVDLPTVSVRVVVAPSPPPPSLPSPSSPPCADTHNKCKKKKCKNKYSAAEKEQCKKTCGLCEALPPSAPPPSAPEDKCGGLEDKVKGKKKECQIKNCKKNSKSAQKCKDKCKKDGKKKKPLCEKTCCDLS